MKNHFKKAGDKKVQYMGKYGSAVRKKQRQKQTPDFWRRNTAKVKSIILNQKKANTCSDHSCTSSFEQVDTDIHFRKNKKKLSDQCEGMSFVKQLNFIDTSREKIEPSNDSTIKWEVDSNNDQWLSDNQEVESDVIEDAIKQERIPSGTSISESDESVHDDKPFIDDMKKMIFSCNVPSAGREKMTPEGRKGQQFESDESVHDDKPFIDDMKKRTFSYNIPSAGREKMTPEGQKGQHFESDESVLDDKPFIDDMEESVFSLRVSSADWKKMMPKGKKDQRFNSGWTDIVYDYTMRHVPECAIRFQYHHFKKLSSRKKNAPYFHAKASCVIEGCRTFDYQMLDEPQEHQDVELILQVSGSLHHPHKENVKSQLKGDIRKEVGKQVLDEGVTTTYYRKVAKASDSELNAGNITSCQSKDVLRKAALE